MKKNKKNTRIEKNLYYCEKIEDFCPKMEENTDKENVLKQENCITENTTVININKRQHNEVSKNSLLTIFKTSLENFFKSNTSSRIKTNKDHHISKSEHFVLTENPSAIGLLSDLILKDDNSFYITFLSTFPNFTPSLLKLNPTLKSSDIEFCALIKLNLETKQIARYKKISVRAVEGKKYRIRKKLNISTEENMYIWMARI